MVPVAHMGDTLRRMARAVALPATVPAADTQRAMVPAADTPRGMDLAVWQVTVDRRAGMSARFEGCTTTSTTESTTERPRGLLHEATAVRAEAPELSILQATVLPVVLREAVTRVAGPLVEVRPVAAICHPTAMDPQAADHPVEDHPEEDRQAATLRLIREARPVPFIIMDLMTV
jgi:hypothetical protein